jgi:hypothetical protein
VLAATSVVGAVISMLRPADEEPAAVASKERRALERAAA